MVAEGGRTRPLLSEQLFNEAYRFDFFQAVRVLESLRRESAGDASQRPGLPVGGDAPPDREIVRFNTVPSHGFPPGSIRELRRTDGAGSPPVMRVAFLGLAGAVGALPQHYTSMILRRSQIKDHSFRDFLELFNHRLISLFYRAWEKYHFPVAYERTQHAPEGARADLFTHCLFCLSGMGTDGQRGRLSVDDEAFIYYVGHFSHFPRNASALEQMLGDYFGLPVAVEQFVGQWLYLAERDRSFMPGERQPGQNAQLGVNLIAGERVWDSQSKFRVRVGPLDYRQFCELMPIGTALRQLFQFARMYVGAQLDFDVQPVLEAGEVPLFRLDETAPGPRLGWNTWAHSLPMDHDAEDVIFLLESELC